MTTVLLVGAGAVGTRAGRQLVDTPDVERVLIADRSSARSRALAHALGPKTEAIEFPADALPDVRAVATALPASTTMPVARAAVAKGCSIASVCDEEPTLAALLALDAPAREAGVAVVAGCALVPGLAEVLARHAASALDSADEVHVARFGAAGPECVAALRRARRERPLEWHDGAWRSERRLGPQLVWFPDPIAAQECESAAAGVALVRDALPNVRGASVRLGEPPPRGVWQRMFGAKPTDDGWGAARVEVWGWRGNAREAIVYGVIEHPAVAAGTVLAVTAARLAGALPSVDLAREPVGASGLGTLVEPAPFLAELARRGVKAAAFEGVTV